MPKFIIKSVKKTQAGNYTLRTVTGERVHLRAADLEEFGLTPDKVKAPLFINGSIETYPNSVYDPATKEWVKKANEPETFDRLTAIAVWETRVGMIKDFAAQESIEDEVHNVAKRNAAVAASKIPVDAALSAILEP